MAGKGGPAPFLRKTWEIVSDPTTDAVISWSTQGSSFVVWRPAEFARDILPAHFKHCNFSSFVRQLNTYGFRKVDPDRWEFANEGFRRDNRDLMMSIVRRKPATTTGPTPHGSTPTAGGGSSTMLQDSLMTDGMLSGPPSQHLPTLQGGPSASAAPSLPPGSGLMPSYPLLPMPFPLDITSGLIGSGSSDLAHMPAGMHPGNGSLSAPQPTVLPQQQPLPQPASLPQAAPSGMYNPSAARTSALLDAVAMAQGNLTTANGAGGSTGVQQPSQVPSTAALPSQPPVPPVNTPTAAGQQMQMLDPQSRLQNMLQEYFKPGSQVLASIGQDAAGALDVVMLPQERLSRGNSSRFVSWQPPGGGSGSGSGQHQQQRASKHEQQWPGNNSGGSQQQESGDWVGASSSAAIELSKKAPSEESPVCVLETTHGSASTSSGVNAPVPTVSQDQGVDIDEYVKSSKRRRDKLYVNRKEGSKEQEREPSGGDRSSGGADGGDDMEGVQTEAEAGATAAAHPQSHGPGAAAGKPPVGGGSMPLRPTAHSMPRLTQNILAEMAVQLNRLTALATEVEGLKEENQQLRMSMDVLRHNNPPGGSGGNRNSGSDDPPSGAVMGVDLQACRGDGPTPSTSKSLSGSGGAVHPGGGPQASSGGTGGSVDGAHNQQHTSGSSERADNGVVTPQLEAMLMEQHERFWAMKLRNDQVELQMAAQMQQSQEQQERTAALEAQLAVQIKASVDTVELAKTLQERLAAQYHSTLEADARSRELEARLRAQESENAVQRHMQAAMQAKIHALEEQVAGGDTYTPTPHQQLQQNKQQHAGAGRQQQQQQSAGSSTLPQPVDSNTAASQQ